MKKTMRIILASLLAFMLVGCQPNQPKVDYRYKELVNGLSDPFQYIESTQPGSWFLRVSADGTMLIGIYCSGEAVSGKITNVEYLENDDYKFKLEVPAFEGDMITDAYDAYTLDFTIHYDMSDLIVVQFPEEYNVGKIEMGADRARSQTSLLDMLNSHGTYFSDDICISFADRKYNKWINNSDFHVSGEVSDLQYKGFGIYSFTCTYLPEENGKEYKSNVELTLMENNLALSICEESNDEFEIYYVKAEQ